MKNRAKCRLCNTTIESFHPTDYVTCKCGEISVSEGDAMRCSALDFKNFLRVDDVGNEIIVTVKKEEVLPNQETSHRPNREELLQMLDEMIKSYENLPQHAMLAPITHSDFCSSLMLLLGIFRSS